MLMLHMVHLEMLYSNPLNQVLAQVGIVMVATESTSENLVTDLDGDDAMDVVITRANGITEQANVTDVLESSKLITYLLDVFLAEDEKLYPFEYILAAKQ